MSLINKMSPPYFYQHGSNELDLDKESRRGYLDFSVNINPWGPPASVEGILHQSASLITHYPSMESQELKGAVAQFHRIRPEQILVGNGSTELIYLAAQIRRGKTGYLFVPTFSEYERALKAAGCRVKFGDGSIFFNSITHKKNRTVPIDIVFIGNPNNPTGTLIPKIELLRVIDQNPGTLFVIDEAFIDFSDTDQSLIGEAGDLKNLLVLRSLTKSFAIPGLRIGYAAAHPRIIEELAGCQPPWSVNALAQEAGKQCLQEKEYIEQSKRKIQEAYGSFFERLSEVSWLKPSPSQANFILCRIVDPQLSSSQLQKSLLSRKILIRNCDNFRGLEQGRYIRLAVRKLEENEVLIKEMSSHEKFALV